MLQDIGERNNVSLRLVRQLIPLPKLQAEVITLEPWGSVTDTKGNRLQEFDKDKKHVSVFLLSNYFYILQKISNCTRHFLIFFSGGC